MTRCEFPASQRAQATREQLRTMGDNTEEDGGDTVLVYSRIGRTVSRWRRQLAEVFERVDDAAPVAPEGSKMITDPREGT